MKKWIVWLSLLLASNVHALLSPGSVTFSNPTGLNTTATFGSTGTYTLQFCSSDGAKSQCAQMTVTVNPSVVMPKMVVGAGSAIAGNSVDIPVNFVAGSVGAAGLQFDLVLPAGVSSNTITAGPATLAAGKGISSNIVGGALRLLITGINQNIIQSGLVAVINLKLAESTPAGSLPLTLTNVVSSDINGNNIPMAASGIGNISVTANKTPVVTVGPNQTVVFPGPANLTATATDDGAPNPPGALNNAWSVQ